MRVFFSSFSSARRWLSVVANGVALGTFCCWDGFSHKFATASNVFAYSREQKHYVLDGIQHVERNAVKCPFYKKDIRGRFLRRNTHAHDFEYVREWTHTERHNDNDDDDYMRLTLFSMCMHFSTAERNALDEIGTMFFWCVYSLDTIQE